MGCKTVTNRTSINTKVSKLQFIHLLNIHIMVIHANANRKFLRRRGERIVRRLRRWAMMLLGVETLYGQRNITQAPSCSGRKYMKYYICYNAESTETQLIQNYVLFTNRAQARIKLKKHQDAVDDCKEAIKLKQDCLKTIVITTKVI